MWTVRDEPAERPDVNALIRGYFAELTVRYFKRATDEAEIDLTLAEFPAHDLGAFLVLRADGVAAGHLGVYPTGELTRFYVAPEHRRGGGGRALLAAAEAWAAPSACPASSSTPATTWSRPAVLRVLRLHRDPRTHGHPGPVPGSLVREDADGVTPIPRGKP